MEDQRHYSVIDNYNRKLTLKYKNEVDIIYYTEEEKKKLKAKFMNEISTNTNDNSSTNIDKNQDSGSSNKSKKTAKIISKKYYEKSIYFFNLIITGKYKDQDYIELAYIKKAEVFAKMKDYIFALKQYNYFISRFPKSKYIVNVFIKKSDILVNLRKYKDAISNLQDILDTYPEDIKANFIRLKIDYIKLLTGKGIVGDTDEKKKEENIKLKIKLLNDFEKQLKVKETYLKNLENVVKKDK